MTPIQGLRTVGTSPALLLAVAVGQRGLCLTATRGFCCSVLGSDTPQPPGALHLGCKGTGSPPSLLPPTPPQLPGGPSQLTRRCPFVAPIAHPSRAPGPTVQGPQIAPSSARPGSGRAAPGGGQLPPVCPAPPRPSRRAWEPGTAWLCAHGGGPPRAPRTRRLCAWSQECGGTVRGPAQVGGGTVTAGSPPRLCQLFQNWLLEKPRVCRGRIWL